MRRWLDQTAGEAVVALSEHVSRCAECNKAPNLNPEDLCPLGRDLLSSYSLRRMYDSLHAKYVLAGLDPVAAEKKSRASVTIEQIRYELEHWDELDMQVKHYLALRLVEIVAVESAQQDIDDGDGDGGTQLKIA